MDHSVLVNSLHSHRNLSDHLLHLGFRQLAMGPEVRLQVHVRELENQDSFSWCIDDIVKDDHIVALAHLKQLGLLCSLGSRFVGLGDN